MPNIREQNFKHFDGVMAMKDRIIFAIFSPFIPPQITPNHITMFRIVMIPIVMYFLLNYMYGWGLFLFFIAALSDAVDGAFARLRDQITEWGKLFDPIADKVLIGSTALVVLPRFLGMNLALIIIVSEILLLISAHFRNKKHGKTVEANNAGKTKMVLQSLGVGFVMLYAIFSLSWILLLAQVLIYLALFFALLSLLVYKSI